MYNIPEPKRKIFFWRPADYTRELISTRTYILIVILKKEFVASGILDPKTNEHLPMYWCGTVLFLFLLKLFMIF